VYLKGLNGEVKAEGRQRKNEDLGHMPFFFFLAHAFIRICGWSGLGFLV